MNTSILKLKFCKIAFSQKKKYFWKKNFRHKHFSKLLPQFFKCSSSGMRHFIYLLVRDKNIFKGSKSFISGYNIVFPVSQWFFRFQNRTFYLLFKNQCLKGFHKFAKSVTSCYYRFAHNKGRKSFNFRLNRKYFIETKIWRHHLICFRWTTKLRYFCPYFVYTRKKVLFRFTSGFLVFFKF